MSEPYSPEHLAACEQAARELREKLAARPVTPNAHSVELRLRHCDLPCPLSTCHMECAIIPDRLQWWEREAKRVREKMGVVLTYGGRAFPDPMGSA